MDYLTPSNIMFTIGLIGIIITVFRAINDPQKKSETNDALMQQESKLNKEENNRKFIEINKNVSLLTQQNQNHIHTIDTKVDALTNEVQLIGQNMVELRTIINERIPPKS